LVEPPGTSANAVSVPTSPFAASFGCRRPPRRDDVDAVGRRASGERARSAGWWRSRLCAPRQRARTTGGGAVIEAIGFTMSRIAPGTLRGWLRSRAVAWTDGGARRRSSVPRTVRVSSSGGRSPRSELLTRSTGPSGAGFRRWRGCAAGAARRVRRQPHRHVLATGRATGCSRRCTAPASNQAASAPQATASNSTISRRRRGRCGARQQAVAGRER
jgi:hypothetical protein